MKLIRKTTVKLSSTGKSKSSWGIFLCQFCNTEVERQLTSGKRNHSCGCASADLVSTHGASRYHEKEPLYVVFEGMISRCERPKHRSYSRYGGRGIFVCKEWRFDYLAFKKWAIAAGWKQALHIDRIDNDGPYHPDNCRIVTPAQNSRTCSQAKLTEKDAISIRKKHAKGELISSLASHYKVHITTITRIVKNKSWKLEEVL